jgi:hypothetical protein
MHGIRAKVNAAGPFHAAEIGIDGDGIEDTGVQQLEEHAAAPRRFDGENPPDLSGRRITGLISKKLGLPHFQQVLHCPRERNRNGHRKGETIGRGTCPAVADLVARAKTSSGTDPTARRRDGDARFRPALSA